MTWVWALFALLASAAWLALVYGKFTCRCGRSHGWYFASTHERAWLMLAYAVISTAFTVLNVLVTDWFAVVIALIAAYHWRRWWYHESGKLKRKLHVLGRVRINEHGRLVVEQ